MAKSSVFKACLKVVTVLGDRQLYGSEFHTEGELRLKDFADIARDIRVTRPEMHAQGYATCPLLFIHHLLICQIR